MAVDVERARRLFTIEEYVRMWENKRERATPSDVLLVVEVADTSLRYDRTVKLRLYARARIPEYWIVDAGAETLEIYRTPSGEQYGDLQRPARGTTVPPLAFPDASFPIDAIFV